MTTDPKSHGNAEVVELLRRVKDLLAGPEKNGANLAKVEEAHSFTASGIGCEASEDIAARWTVTGALARFAMTPIAWASVPGGLRSTPVMRARDEAKFDLAFRFLYGAAILERPQTVNGVNNRGWDAVRDLIEFAILLAEHEASILPMLALQPNSRMSPELHKRLQQIVQARGIQSVQVPS